MYHVQYVVICTYCTMSVATCTICTRLDSCVHCSITHTLQLTPTPHPSPLLPSTGAIPLISDLSLRFPNVARWFAALHSNPSFSHGVKQVSAAHGYEPFAVSCVARYIHVCRSYACSCYSWHTEMTLNNANTRLLYLWSSHHETVRKLCNLHFFT